MSGNAGLRDDDVIQPSRSLTYFTTSMIASVSTRQYGALQSGDRVAVRGAEALDDGELVAVQTET